ncbi:MAG: immunity 22 family protein, partial [Clostridiales bacterium]|nr:immunity 22 family protein [Clostridiales bacterium]
MNSIDIEYECQCDGRVSVWYGCFNTEADLVNYLETSYTEDGNMSSGFLSEFPIVDFDEDLSERSFFKDIFEFMKRWQVSYTQQRKHFLFIQRGFLLSGGAGKPQECLLPFKVLPRRLA